VATGEQDLRPDIVVNGHKEGLPHEVKIFDQLRINNIRTLAIDAVEAPGIRSSRNLDEGSRPPRIRSGRDSPSTTPRIPSGPTGRPFACSAGHASTRLSDATVSVLGRDRQTPAIVLWKEGRLLRTDECVVTEPRLIEGGPR
jgi:hypothetical protein